MIFIWCCCCFCEFVCEIWMYQHKRFTLFVANDWGGTHTAQYECKWVDPFVKSLCCADNIWRKSHSGKLIQSLANLFELFCVNLKWGISRKSVWCTFHKQATTKLLLLLLLNLQSLMWKFVETKRKAHDIFQVRWNRTRVSVDITNGIWDIQVIRTNLKGAKLSCAALAQAKIERIRFDLYQQQKLVVSMKIRRSFYKWDWSKFG